jgi:hypothetical protein
MHAMLLLTEKYCWLSHLFAAGYNAINTSTAFIKAFLMHLIFETNI